MNGIEKIKGVAIFVFAIFTVLLFIHIVQLIRMLMPAFYTPWAGFSLAGFQPLFFTFTFLILVFHIVLYTACFLLLRTIMKNETPFKKKTAVLLKIIALFFISRDVEGIIFSIQAYSQFRSSPAFSYAICSYTGEYIYALLATSLLWFGGYSNIAGFIIYLISLVVDYGISLQIQVDETL